MALADPHPNSERTKPHLDAHSFIQACRREDWTFGLLTQYHTHATTSNVNV